jgi:hypothetical protein
MNLIPVSTLAKENSSLTAPETSSAHTNKQLFLEKAANQMAWRGSHISIGIWTGKENQLPDYTVNTPAHYIFTAHLHTYIQLHSQSMASFCPSDDFRHHFGRIKWL